MVENTKLSTVSDADHEKISKKELLLGRRKDKKDKKDRGYATLDGESSPEDDHDMKYIHIFVRCVCPVLQHIYFAFIFPHRSPSKSAKKSKAFKFASKCKEKREKSRDKEKIDVKDCVDAGKETKKKDKDKKDKDKKDKGKDKDKKEKKSKQSSINEEIIELGGECRTQHTHTL